MGQNGKQCKEQGKSFQSVLGKRHHAELEVVEPNEEVQLDIAGPMPDDLDKDAYILAAIDRFSKQPHHESSDKNHGRLRHKFYAKLHHENGVPRRIRCDLLQS